MAPYFWKMNQEKKSVGRLRRSSNQGGNTRSQNPRANAFDNYNAGVRSRFKRKFVGETSGQSIGDVSIRIHQHAEGSRSNPIPLDDSDNSLDDSVYLTKSNQAINGRKNTRNVRLRPSSSCRTSLPLKIDPTGGVLSYNDMRDSDSDSDTDLDIDLDADLDIDSDASLDLDSDSNSDSELKKNLKMGMELELSPLTGRPAGHVVSPQSALSVGSSRGAGSRSADSPNVVVSGQGHTQFTEAARRMSKELLEHHEGVQQLTQISRTGNLSVSGGIGNAPAVARVSVPASDSATIADGNTPISHTRGTGNSILSGWSTAEVIRGSAVAADRIVHPVTLPMPMPLFGPNGVVRNLQSAINSIRLRTGGDGPSRQTASMYGINVRGTDHASTSNIQPLPVSLAALSHRPIPVSALNGQVILANHSNQETTKDTWPMPPVQEDTWPMTTSIMPAALSSQLISMSGTNGNQHTRRRRAVSRQKRGGARRTSSSLESPAAAGNSQNMPELESALESMRRSEPVRAEGTMVLNYTSGVAEEAEDTEDADDAEDAEEAEDAEDAEEAEEAEDAEDAEDAENVEEAEDAEDALSDMRLDVDNMSYEELLDLEAQIGNVNTGLTEKVAKKRLKLRKFVQRKKEIEPCCICQDEFKKGDMLGNLKSCSHTFHPDCIKQWLMVKDSCPICKTATGASK